MAITFGGEDAPDEGITFLDLGVEDGATVSVMLLTRKLFLQPVNDLPYPMKLNYYPNKKLSLEIQIDQAFKNTLNLF